MEIHGWGAYVLKEKLKRVKEKMREWNLNVFSNVEEKKEVIRKMNDLDSKEEGEGLNEDEVLLKRIFVRSFGEMLLVMNLFLKKV